jgi:UDP-N-acetylglucosamine--N-acetylmuramyl-(pentapeptide) pyrophosphoryl-undecaprenol N-acetylglucosamine transferase
LTPFATWIATADPPRAGKTLPRKFRHVGNPVRAGFLKPVNREAGRTFFRLHANRPVCFVSGGSQGAVGVNQLVLDVLGRLRDLEHPASRWQFLWATGPGHYEHVMRQIALLGVEPSEHSINPYIDEMTLAYAAADVVIARAGALTLAELTVMGQPAVLVPLPTSAHGHQLGNARAMERAGAARVLNERDKHAADQLEQWLIEWMEHPEQLAGMASASRGLGRPQAAEDLAGLVLESLGLATTPEA